MARPPQVHLSDPGVLLTAPSTTMTPPATPTPPPAPRRTPVKHQKTGKTGKTGTKVRAVDTTAIDVHDLTVPGGPVGQIWLRIFRPAGATGPLPVSSSYTAATRWSATPAPVAWPPSSRSA